MGRKEKLNPDRQKIIVEAIAAGSPHETAVALAGVSKSAFYEWINTGSTAASGKYKSFHDAVKKAEADAEAARIRRIDQAGKDGDWKADAWYLERRYPERWGRRVISADLNHTGEVTQSHEYEAKYEIVHKLQDDEEGRELLKKLFEWEQRANREGNRV